MRERKRERERAYKITGGETGLCGILWGHTELHPLSEGFHLEFRGRVIYK